MNIRIFVLKCLELLKKVIFYKKYSKIVKVKLEINIQYENKTYFEFIFSITPFFFNRISYLSMCLFLFLAFNPLIYSIFMR